MTPTPRPLAKADIDALIASRSGHQVGDFIEPLRAVDGEAGTTMERIVLRVIRRYEDDDSPGAAWKYDAVDADGRPHEVWRMDDPRPADEEQAVAFRAREAARSR